MALRICLTACLVIVVASSQRAASPSLAKLPNNCTTDEQTSAQQCLQSIDTLLMKNRKRCKSCEQSSEEQPPGNPSATTMSVVAEFLCGPLAVAFTCIEQLPRPCFSHLDLPEKVRWVLLNPRITSSVSDIFRRMCSVPHLDQHLIRIGECATALDNLPLVQNGSLWEEMSRAVGPPQPIASYDDFDWECRAHRRQLEIMNLDLVTTTCGVDAGTTYFTAINSLVRDVLLCSE
ncbi:uncharacterized protein LOC129582314 [Paramacrobiotus metropolitanus]|uniref:uncharacterized protein LOC129582314 n=1 Tax=Paramacrobiotus metropolitanus TaxID=2943436 RepID=UPI0024460924|nr:uncharacterized protein LOC129582314 [Paramacrobiotus metropolitanus]